MSRWAEGRVSAMGLAWNARVYINELPTAVLGRDEHVIVP
jgi:hypothetical protein